MHSPLQYDRLTCESFNLDTNITNIRDISIEDIKPTESDLIEILDSMLQDRLPYDEDMKFIDLNLDQDYFSRTYFDDLKLDDAYDTLFADIVPNPTLRWAAPIPVKKGVQIHDHDCMWAGHCGSSDPECDRALCRMMADYVPPPRVPTPVAPQTSQQSLLKPNLRNAGIPVINMIAPQTPPMSDDDEKKDKLSDILSSRLLGESSSDMDEADRELREYLRRSTFDAHEEEEQNPDSSSESSESSESEDESPQQTDPSMPTSIRCNMYATVNDHSYHKDNSSMIMSDLGIDTPSDSGGSTPPRCDSVKSGMGESKKISRRELGRCNAVVANDMFDNALAKNSFITDKREEEIDVVSISDKKYPVGTRMGYIPPSNPPNGGRRNIQRVAESTVIPVGRNNRNGLKIMLPTKRSLPASDNYPPAKRRSAPANENKGRKPRQTRNNQSNGRRRNDSEGSDFEQQPPMEKRNLHNDMERQRRVDLRKAFEELRQKVPEVARKERAAKVVILREAAKYCNNLTQASTNLQQQRADLKMYQDRLQWKLKYLRRQVALENGVYDQENYDEYEED